MLKILKINKTEEPWQPQGKSWKLYGYWCDVEYNGHKGNAKVATFTPNIEVKPGAVFENNVTKENKNYNVNGQTVNYVQFTIKAEKKPFKGGYQPKEKYTVLEFEAVMNKALQFAKKRHEMENGILEATAIFQSYVKYAFDHGLKIDKQEYMEPENPNREDPTMQDDFMDDKSPDVPF